MSSSSGGPTEGHQRQFPSTVGAPWWIRAPLFLCAAFYPVNFLLQLNFGLAPGIPWSLLIVALYIALLLSVLARAEGVVPVRLSTRDLRSGFVLALGALAGAVAIQILMTARMGILINPVFFVERMGLGASWIHLLTYVAAGAIIEEVAFRGMIQTGLRRWLSPPLAIFLSSAAFALWHYGNDGFEGFWVFYFSVGVWFGIAFHIGGNLWPLIIVHAIYNYAMAIAPLFFEMRLDAGLSAPKVGAFLLLVLFCAIAVWIGRKYRVRDEGTP